MTAATTNVMTMPAAANITFITPRKSEWTGSPCWPASEIVFRRPHITESNHRQNRGARVAGDHIKSASRGLL